MGRRQNGTIFHCKLFNPNMANYRSTASASSLTHWTDYQSTASGSSSYLSMWPTNQRPLYSKVSNPSEGHCQRVVAPQNVSCSNITATMKLNNKLTSCRSGCRDNSCINIITGYRYILTVISTHHKEPFLSAAEIIIYVHVHLNCFAKTLGLG